MADPAETAIHSADYGTGATRYIVGDSLSVMRSLPNDSVDLVLSSPPFLGLRSYLPVDHPDKVHEIGSESTPGEFIDTLLEIVEECRRVLAPHGSLCFELGDTYAGSGGAGGDYGTSNPGAKPLREGQPKFEGSALRARRTRNANRPSGERASNSQDGRRVRSEDEALGILTPRVRPGPQGRDEMPGWPLDKSLCLIPEIFRFSLVYGFNPLTGRETPRWRARNVVRWVRPNPPVGALADKFRPGTSDLLIVCMDRKRYFDLDGVRIPSDYDRPNLRGNGSRGPGEEVPGQKRNHSDHTTNPAGAPPLDWWCIPPKGYEGSHYATYPEELCVRPIVAMCPPKVCTECGKPSERIVSIDHQPNRNTNGPQSIERKHLDGGSAGYSVRADRIAETVGWTDCGHDSWRAGVVLDPFAGSGTTLAVAQGHGRSSIGIDLDERNADLARRRVGMWLEVERITTPEEASV